MGLRRAADAADGGEVESLRETRREDRRDGYAVVASRLAGLAVAGFIGQGRGMEAANDYATIITTGALRDIEILEKGTEVEQDELGARINENPGDYLPPVFIALARLLFARGETEGAYFWFCFGRLRGRYDAERCADITAHPGVDVMIMDVDPELRRYFTTIDPDGIIPFGEYLLDLDAATPHNYDHRWIALHGMGAFGRGGPAELCVPEAEWPRLLQETREEFRKSVEDVAAQLRAPKEQ